ncbi:MAG: hypothetical protein WAW67_06580, partial [Candidatus Omnitrophota bacterium]
GQLSNSPTANNPKFCLPALSRRSKICPEGVARQNPTRILSASQGIPDFSIEKSGIILNPSL